MILKKSSNNFYDSSLKFIPLDQYVQADTLQFEFHILCTRKMRVDTVYDHQTDKICEVIPQVCLEFNLSAVFIQ